MTVRELFREMAAYKERRGLEHDRDMSIAWHVAALTRGTKGLPKLKTLMTRRTENRQSASEQSAMWRVIAARFGGTFKPLDPKTVIRRG
jgi:hypothetical protein